MKITAQLVKELREKTDAAMMSCKKALEETGGDLEAAIEYLRKAGVAKAQKRAGKTAAEGKIGITLAQDSRTAFMVEINSETDFVSRDQTFNGFLQTVLQAGLTQKAQDATETLALVVNGQALDQTRQELASKIGENIQLRRAVFMQAKTTIGHYLHSDRIGVLVELDVENPELAKDLAMQIAATNPDGIRPEDIAPAVIEKEKEIVRAQVQESGKPAEIIEKMVAGRITKFLNEVSLLGQTFVKDSSLTINELLKQHKANVLRFVRFEVGEGIEKETHDFAEEVMAQVKGAN